MLDRKLWYVWLFLHRQFSDVKHIHRLLKHKRSRASETPCALLRSSRTYEKRL
ncbi:hypothetical protein Plhal304r1_c061g0148391 [Plasmopara halstedii]